jgi:hypothetical protein
VGDIEACCFDDSAFEQARADGIGVLVEVDPCSRDFARVIVGRGRVSGSGTAAARRPHKGKWR